MQGVGTNPSFSAGTESQRSPAKANGSGASGVFLSTEPATPGHRRAALIVVAISAVAFLGLAPFAKVQLAPVQAFIPIYQSALFIDDLITAILLLGVFRSLRSPAVLILAGGYVFTTTMTVFHTLSFPGLFAPGGLLGGGTQTTAWLYMFWHAGLPLAVIAYALAKRRARRVTMPMWVAVCLCIGVTIGVAGSLALLATAGHGMLPSIMQGNQYTPAMVAVVGGVWSLSAVALAVLWRARPHSFLDVWLLVAMCAWLFDIALSAMLNHGRFDLGFYTGRIYGLVAVSIVLVVMLLEHGRLYFELARAHATEQEALRQARAHTVELLEANRHLDTFASTVSHDLRGPLRGIGLFASILEEDHSDGLEPAGLQAVAQIQDRVGRMNEQIDALLAFSRLGRQALKARATEMEGLVTATIDELRESYAGRHIQFSVGRLGIATVDPVLMKHVLANLLGNAVKFSGNRETATVEVGRQDVPGGGPPVYWVKDNGAGFDMRYADKLFGMFTRLHNPSEFEGTGVGLSIVQSIVQRHGGRIWAESRPDEGATFFFTLQEESGTDA